MIATLSRKTGISKSLISLATDLIGYNDLYTMITGKDAETGKPRSRLVGAAWTAFNFMPVSKIAKLAKVAKMINKARKAEEVVKEGNRLRKVKKVYKIVSKERAEQRTEEYAEKAARKLEEQARRNKKGANKAVSEITKRKAAELLAKENSEKAARAAAKKASQARVTRQTIHEATHRAGNTLAKKKIKQETVKSTVKKGKKPIAERKLTKAEQKAYNRKVGKKPTKKQKKVTKRRNANKARANSKARSKGGNNKTKKGRVAHHFNYSSNAEPHLKNVEKVNGNGVIGGHNKKAFYKAIKEKADKIGVKESDLIISRTDHPTIDGITEIRYKLPKMDNKKIVPGEYKDNFYPKTVYDPAKISDKKIYAWGKEAMKYGKINKKEHRIEGKAPNGLKFVGYMDSNGVVTNFYPVLSFSNKK